MASLRLTLFGLPCIERDGVPRALERRKALALLAYLALSPNPLSRDFLAELLWPERDGPTARTDLRTALFALRQALGPGWLATEGDLVGLQRGPDLWIDVEHFLRVVETTASHEHASGVPCDAVVAALTEAVGLYRGDFLAGFTLRDAPEFDNWQTYQTESLRLELAGVLERLAWLEAAGGDYETAVRHGRSWLELDPLCEEPHRALMRLFAESGNRAAALRQYGECVRVLDEELGIKPDVETIALRDAVAGGAVPAHPGVALRPPPLELPSERTPFIGREAELAQIAERLADSACRLLTVLGPGGSGKTRLAVQAARRQAGQYRDGIYFVDLQPVETADLLVPTIAHTLSAPTSGASSEDEQLIAWLRERQLLLVLDNFEHLLGGVELLPRLLDAAPEAKLLITSRARLNLVEEWLLPLGGMALPPETMTHAALGDFSATALFQACASRLRPDYRPAPREAAEIARVCRLLEGMPLGIELAAARTRTLPVGEIAAELARGLDVLATTMRDAPARHRSMAASFDASWRLLSPGERHVMRCASAFRGGFTTEAAGAVTGATRQELDALADSCWLRVEAGGRWGVHELIRQYCEAKLRTEHRTKTGEGEVDIRARHVAYFRWFITEKHIAFQARPEALAEIEPELGNLLAAWEGLSDPADLTLMRQVTAGFDLMAERLVWWPVVLPLIEQSIRWFRAALAQGDGEPASRRRLEMAIAWHMALLTKGKQMTGHYGDSHICLDEAEALLGDGGPDDLDWAQTHYMIVRNRAWLNYLMGRWVEAERGWLDALAQIRDTRSPVWVFPPHNSLLPQAETLLGLAWNALESGRYEQGLTWAREAVEMAEEFGSPAYEAMMRSVLISLLAAKGQYHEAERVAKRALHMAHEVHATDIIIQCLAPMASMYRDMGRPDQVRIWARRYVALCEETGYCESGLPWVLTNLSWAELELGHVAEARRYARRSMELVEQSGGAGASGYSRTAVMLGRVALAEGKPEAALHWVDRALRSPARLALATTGAACLLADIRRAQGRQEEAMELLATVTRTSLSGHATRQRAAAAWRELASESPSQIYATAVARGESRELEELVAELLAEGDHALS